MAVPVQGAVTMTPEGLSLTVCKDLEPPRSICYLWRARYDDGRSTPGVQSGPSG